MTERAEGAGPGGAGAKYCVLCGARFTDGSRFCPIDGHPLRDENASDPLIGTMVGGRYLVQRKLGEGGMGSVYEADQVSIGRKVALKVLPQARVAIDPAAPLRFAREASNASRLSHQNVASVFDFGEAPDSELLYLAMEFVDGESLGALLRREGSVTPRRAASIAWQVAEALHAAHEQGVIHRDLKPDNVMLTTRPDGSDFVKVVDFGISRVMDSATQQVTSTGLAIGTPQYMSPEQLRAEDIDARSDVFGLGLVCYRMLGGELPWPNGTKDEILARRLLVPRKALREMRPEVEWPESVQAVLDGAIALEPDQRYVSAIQFALDLTVAIQGWIPDDPAGHAPWDRKLRLPTPTGSLRVPSGQGPAIGDAPVGVATRLLRGDPPTPPAPVLPVAEPAAREPNPTLTAGIADTRDRVPPPPPLPARRWKRSRVAFITMLGVTGVVLTTWQASQRDGATGVSDTSVALGAPVATDSVLPPAPPVTSPKDREPSPVSGGTKAGAAPSPKPVVPGDSGSAQPKQTPTTGSPSTVVPSDGLTGAQVRDMLDRLAQWSGPQATPQTALDALRLAPDLLRLLPTLEDSVEAQLRQAEAHLVLDQPAMACRILLQVEARAAGTRFRPNVGVYLGDPELHCRTR